MAPGVGAQAILNNNIGYLLLQFLNRELSVLDINAISSDRLIISCEGNYDGPSNHNDAMD